jgi:transcriptional regulator of nitric oxide reductase
MSKTFNVAGFSSKDGKVSFRVANGSAAARTKVLAKDGHENIDLIDLPREMSKDEAAAFVAQAMGKTVPAATVKPKVEKVAGIKVTPAKETFKVTKTVKEVQEMIAPKPVLTEAEKEIKEKNLQTMQAVSARLSKMRDYD